MSAQADQVMGLSIMHVLSYKLLHDFVVICEDYTTGTS